MVMVIGGGGEGVGGLRVGSKSILSFTLAMEIAYRFTMFLGTL